MFRRPSRNVVLQSSSFLVMTYSLLRDYDIQPKNELHWSPWVNSGPTQGGIVKEGTQKVQLQ